MIISGISLKIVLALGVLLAFLLANIITQLFLRNTFFKRKTHKGIQVLIHQGLRILFLVVGIISALGTLGINISALIAGLGLGGFALGFALRDILSNFVAGIMILIYNPFSVGDVITVSGQTGKVVTIDLRYTELELDNEKILIPNQSIFSNSVTIKES